MYSFVWTHVFTPACVQVCNAIKSSQHGGALKSHKEGSRRIHVEITPTSSRISRNAVTSLSIRGHRWKRHGERRAGGVACVVAPGATRSECFGSSSYFILSRFPAIFGGGVPLNHTHRHTQFNQKYVSE